MEEYLSPDLLKQYLSLVTDTGWCKNFDHTTRTCTIYETRPLFCRVSAEVLRDIYHEDPALLDDWAIHCCTEHITQSALFNHLFEPERSYAWTEIDRILNPPKA